MRYLFGELEYLLPQSDPYILHPFSPIEYLPYFGKGLSIRFQNKYSIPLPLLFGPRIVKPHRVIVLLTGNFEITSLDEVLYRPRLKLMCSRDRP